MPRSARYLGMQKKKKSEKGGFKLTKTRKACNIESPKKRGIRRRYEPLPERSMQEFDQATPETRQTPDR